MAAHDVSQVVRVSVTSVPSFLNQNGLMYGVIRQQDTDKTGLTIGCKTAMVSNHTAITLKCVLGQSSTEQSSTEPDSLTEAHFAGSSARRVLRRAGQIKQFVEEVSGETEVYWRSGTLKTGTPADHG